MNCICIDQQKIGNEIHHNKCNEEYEDVYA